MTVAAKGFVAVASAADHELIAERKQISISLSMGPGSTGREEMEARRKEIDSELARRERGLDAAEERERLATLKDQRDRSAVVKMPWSDCKVAFGIEDPNPLGWEQNTPDLTDGRLPSGWSHNELDGTGARWVVVFRIEGTLPTIEDGEAVAALLVEIGANPKPRSKRKAKN